MPNAPPFFGICRVCGDLTLFMTTSFNIFTISMESLTKSCYRIVRYLYMRSRVLFDMSQVMASPKTRSSALIQDVLLKEPITFVESTTKQTKCCVCNKGLEEGLSITARNTSLGIVFFCEIHYPL